MTFSCDIRGQLQNLGAKILDLQSYIRGAAMDDEGELILKKGDSFWRVLANTGSGVFNYKLAALCGLALTSDAIEVLSVANILPEASCDLKLSDEKKGWINSSVFFGMCIGSLLCGCLGDMIGRKLSLILSLSANGLFNFISSLAQTFEFFIIFRILSGIGVGGSVPVLFTYNSEFHTKENRGLSITFMGCFWAIGGIIACGSAWLIIPSGIAWADTIYFQYKSWQWYLLICSLPALMSAVCFMFMPESPKYLYENCDIEETKAVLRLMFKQNKSSYDPSLFEEELLELDNEDKKPKFPRRSINFDKGNICSTLCNILGQMRYYLVNMVKQLGLLFTKDLRCQTIVLLFIYNSMSFGYYGMIMWFPELFKRMDMYNGSICIEGNVTINGNASLVDTCETPAKVYLESMLVLASAIPGSILVILLVNRFGRRLLLSSSLLLSGISVFLIYAMKNSLQAFIFSCIFGMLTSLFWNISNVMLTEAFPSNLRSTGSGFCLSICRFSAILINLLMGYLLQINCVIPLAATAILLSMASFLTWFLKETRNTDLR